MKRILGAIALPILWVWAWIRTPRDMNRNGLPDTTGDREE